MPELLNTMNAKDPSFEFLLTCTIFSLFLGFAVAAVYSYKNKYSKTLFVTLAILPAIVQIIIMLVDGNIGTGIAVAGAFSLIRFRSVPGNARDICFLFFSMALGFICGIGFLFYAFVFLIVVSGVLIFTTNLGFFDNANIRVLRITIPENLDYDGLFDEVFSKFLRSAELEIVKTTNMGSMYELTYTVQLKSPKVPKDFFDELRCRNGNLNISLSREQKGLEL
ncbi:MAG: DUF4956 domain-containing protein [Clostridiales bacterium]|nr:DUF4956 domain-containing protein [Clostridiales bacterium]